MNLTLTIALSTWAVGVQLNELVAAIGCYGTAALLLVQLRPKHWWPLVAFIAWGLLAPLAAGHLPTATGIARLCDFLLMPIAALAVTRARLKPVLIAAAAACAASCLVATLQHFAGWPGHTLEPLPGTARYMAGGLTFHRLKFAESTGLAVVVAASVAVHHRHLRAAALALFGFVAVLVFPAARAAAAALSVALTTLIKPRWLAVPVIAAAALAVAAHPRDESQRAVLLETGLKAVAQHPVVGVGLGRFHPEDFGGPEHGGKAHDQLLTVAAEGGLVHALLFVVLLAWLAARFYRSPESAARTAGLAALTFFALASVVHDPLFHATTSQALALVLGACVGLCTSAARQQQPDEREAQLGRALQVQALGDPAAQKPARP